MNPQREVNWQISSPLIYTPLLPIQLLFILQILV